MSGGLHLQASQNMFVKVKTVWKCTQCGKEIEYTENIYGPSEIEVLDEHLDNHFFKEIPK